MKVEKKIYSSWACTENESEKARINYEIYKELCEKYKITKSPMKWNRETNKLEYKNFDDYDIVLKRTPAYGHSSYSVLKNNTKLSQLEIALICDGGNLCFGYTTRGSDYCIFEY